MTKKKVFIGSSAENYFLAEAFKKVLQNYPDKFEPVTWNDFFKKKAVGKGNIAVLRKAVEECSLSVFFATRDDACVFRGEKGNITRTNIWFEAGMFVAKYDSERVFIMVDKDDENQLFNPTDYQINFPVYQLGNPLKTYINKIREVNTEFKEIRLNRLSEAKAVELTNTLKSYFDTVLLELFEKNHDEEIYSFRNIIGRAQCYQIAEQIIDSADDRIYSIVSYENELDDKEGVFPYLKNRINKGVSSNFKIKRWMNLGNDNIAKQAEDILRNYKQIHVRDTFCHYIEVVIADNNTLIVLPKIEDHETQVGVAILINSKRVSDEFADWFLKVVPEPNGLVINEDNIERYRDQPFDLCIKRNTSPGPRCGLCQVPFSKLKNGEMLGILEKFK